MAKLYFDHAAMSPWGTTPLLQADFTCRERGMEATLWTAAHDDVISSGAEAATGCGDRYVALCHRQFFDRLQENEACPLSASLAES